MKIKTIRILFFVLCLGNASAQIKSNSDAFQVATVTQKVFDAGCHIEKCDSDDSVCFFINALDKKAYESLTQKNIGVLPMFSVRLKKKIDSYSFYSNFNEYFVADTNNYTVFFTKWQNERTAVFGVAECKTDALGSITYSQITATSIDHDKDILANMPEKNHSFLIFSSFLVTLFVNDNQIKIIADGKITDTKSFFSKYDLNTITKLFQGVQKNDPVN